MFTKNNLIKNLASVLCMLVCMTGSQLFAGTTGKISGKIIDKSTGETLIGANVIIMGTSMGSSSDIDGNYFILNIPPGEYQVKASMIGYTSVTFEHVRVSVDQTTKIDFELNSQSIELENVVVTAEKPIVRKDLTSTEQTISGEDISMLPLEDVSSVVNLQAGVINGHFRGGRSDEVRYLIDGVPVNDVYSGQSSLSADVNSIQEVQVLVGTFNAEYGEAQSGVVNQVTKIAGDKLTGNISVYSGDYVSSHKGTFQHINHISPGDVYDLEGNLSGPVPGIGNLLKFFVSGRYNDDEGYIYGQRIFNPKDSSNFSANNPAEWYVGATGDKAYVPMNYSRQLSLQGKLSINVGGGRGIVLTGLYQDNQYKDYNHLYRLNPDGDYTKFQKSTLGIASYTLLLSNAAFIDFSASGLQAEYKQYVYSNPLDSHYVNPDRKKDVSGNAFYTGGTENWHFNHKTTSLTGKIDLSWQIDNINQVKTGVEFTRHDLEYQDFQIIVDAASGFKPMLPSPGAFNYNIYNSNPYQAAYYIQDKIEINYLIVNAGVRFDYFEPDGKYLKDPNKINELDELQPPFPDSLMVKASAKYQFSPRIGLSYPISDQGAIHISYGYFFQIPPFENLYRNPNFRIPLTGDFPENIGNVIGNADLKPQQTIMYEIGLQQALTDDIGMTITGYYKDIRNLLGTEIYIKNEFRKFSKLVNRDYGSVKGITLSLEKRFGRGMGAAIDYTFQVAKGSASDPNAAFNNAEANPPIEENKQLVPLDWDGRHTLRFTLTLGIPGDYIASFIGRLGSGLPYTPSLQNQRTGLENSDNKPSYYDVDLYLTKYIEVAGQQLSIFAKIYNLFDTMNENDVFGDTGRAGYTLELTRNQAAPRGVNTIQEYFTRPDFYSAPRQIIIGAEVSF
ncbi:MAG TPA: TonB-dependent receptor [Ignavibacteriaceae bacterium]|jgi:outer membrane receptor protein involved in Fe transport|nr:TonB-dependent receptor [Ignavibacteriaceae bacterium]